MVVTINPQKIIIGFFKLMLGIIIALFISSIVVFPIMNTSENKEIGTRSITILKKTNNGYIREFKVEDVETGNKFSVTPTRTWYDGMEVGSVTATSASLNDTRVLLVAWLWFSFVIDMVVLAALLIWFLTSIPGMIENLEGKEFTLDLRSTKTKHKEIALKQEELALIEFKKTETYILWKKDYDEQLLYMGVESD